MRPASSRVVVWMSVLFILAALFAGESLAFGQNSSPSKRKLSRHLPGQQVLNGATTKPDGVRPLIATDTWNGGGGSGNTNWSDASNWNNGAITTGENIVITLSGAATNEDDNASIGTLTLGSGDSVTLNQDTTLTVGGNISNAGTITLNSQGYGTALSIGANLTLSGAGTVVLGSGGPNEITGVSGVTLTNASTIVGGGGGTSDQVGYSIIALDNTSTGVINANVSGDNLYVDPGAASINAGTLEATNGGTLVLYGSSWNNAGGKITAANGSAVDLTNGVSITGGTLSTSGTGVIYEAGGTTVYLTNVTLSSGSTYDIQQDSTTQISGSLTNNGTVNLQSQGYGTDLYMATNATLTGSGTVVLGSGGPNFITGAAGTTLTIDQLIQGGGGGSNDNVGYDVLALVNNSTINANVNGLNLYVEPLSTATNTNAGTLEATNGGTLVLYGSSWNNAGGTITAATGSAVDLTDGVSITGGTLSTAGTGVIYELGGQTVYLTNVTLATGSTYDVQQDSSTVISGTITNNGTINLQSQGYGTELYVPASGSATLMGTGTVVLGTGGPNYIGGGASSTLTIDQAISGVGNVGEGQLVLVNNSTIDANISPTVTGSPLYVDPVSNLTNSSTGVLEATNGGTLVLYGGNVTNNGTIQAVGADSSGNASTVELTAGVNITGGTLTTSGAGVIEELTGQTVYLTNVTNNGTYDIQQNSTTEISGTITNNGTINLESQGYGTQLSLAANTTLKGTGTVVLGNGGPNYVDGTTGTTLTLDQTIQGAGYVGGGITILNNSVIDANVNGGILYLEPTGASTNTKTLEATNGGTLVFDGGTWTQTGVGTITAATGSAVELTAGASITDGILTTSGTGVIYEATGTTVYLTNVTNDGTYNIQQNSTTELSGTITNNGTINLQSQGYGTQLYLAANTTLKGKGAVILGSGGPNYVDGATGMTLTNDETIEGAGYIGTGIKVVNSDIINANVSGATLVLEPTTASTNSKTLEATNGGTLEFDGGTWKQTGLGTITAATGSSVELTAGTNISGGVMTTSGTGVIYEATGQTIYLSNITNNGTFDIDQNSTAEISGTITNNGTINLDSQGYAAYLYLSGNTTLNGTGAVVLGSSGPNYIGGVNGAVLTNDSTIEGVGSLGNGQITITNNGTIEALNGTLAILPGSGGFTNYNGTTDSLTGGTYIANGGNLTFAAGNATGITTLSATVVEENGGQLINTTNGSNALASLTSITATGSLTIGGPTFVDAGSFSNAGSLTILKGESFTVGSLSQISGSTLTAGTYVLDANLNLSGATQSITTNATNLTLGGGTIENANSTNALAKLATNSGSLTLANNATFTTAGNFSSTGTLTIDKGSSFTVTGTLAQISGSTLSGGTFVLGGNLNVGSGINITTNATSLTLEGGTIEAGTSNALANLASNTGSLTLANNASAAVSGGFTNSGSLTIDSGSTFTVTGNLTNLSSGTLSGGKYIIGGTMQLASANGGITTNAANLTLTGKTAKILDGTTNALAGFDNNTGTFTLTGDGTLTTAASNFSNSGTVDVATGSTLTVGGTGNSYNQTAGLTTVDGTLTGNVNLTGGTIQGAGSLKGNVSVGGGGTAPTLNVGDAGLAGLLKITGTYTQLSTGTLNVAIGGLTSGTLYSKLSVSGAASLSGTLTVNLINGFVPAVGKSFTILTAKSITGTFSTQYIVINSTEYFAVTYTATGVVLKVDSGAPPTEAASRPAAVVAVVKDKKRILSSDLRKRYSSEAPWHLVASAGRDHHVWDTISQPYIPENRVANELGKPGRLANDVYSVPIWRGPSERPVALPKARVFGINDPSLHAANHQGMSRGVTSPRLPLVNNWQNTELPRMPLKTMMPSLMRPR
jgi:hypothetical protein